MTELEKSIIKTLCYADVFDYPLTKEQIHRYLIAHRPTPLPQLLAALKDLQLKKKLDTKEVYYFLPGRENTVSLKKTKKKNTTKKIRKLNKYISLLGKVPGVRAIFITGAGSMENAAENDDVDLMIVTREGVLWTTRFLVTLISTLLNVRRTPQAKNTSDKLCINLYVAKNSLTVPLKKQDLYTAHEVVQAKPLIDKHQIHTEFLNANQWVLKFLPNAFNPKKIKNNKGEKPKQGLVESTLFAIQKRYMRSKQTREIVDKNKAYFHPRPTGKIVLEKYQRKLNNHI